MKTTFYYIAGLIILCLNKLRYAFVGYKSPKPIGSNDVDGLIEYDFKVVERWTKYLQDYVGIDNPFYGKNILELGPGSDIGVGTILLDNGAIKYTAFDKNNLMQSTPMVFYEKLVKRLKNQYARDEMKEFSKGTSTNLRYVVDSQFNLDTLYDKNIDLIVSQAAFEHFDNVQKTIAQLSRNVKSDTVLCSEIDLQTHSRWIREKDPNNIYRFSEPLYRMLRYAGIPNRVRPEEYKEFFAMNGWKNIRIIPLQTIDANQKKHTLRGLCKRFSGKDMAILTFILLATKK